MPLLQCPIYKSALNFEVWQFLGLAILLILKGICDFAVLYITYNQSSKQIETQIIVIHNNSLGTSL
jgi:hypothetical protein